MGVSGSGKTDTSHAVADALGLPHIEADNFHPAENGARMRAGTPLSDTDRVQWLHALVGEMQRTLDSGSGFVLACSALKRSYRELLRSAVPGLRFAHLAIDYDTAVQRVGARPGHFMPISLVDSQFATLESPEGEPGVLTVDASQPRDVVLLQIVEWMHGADVDELIESRVDLSARPFDSATTAPPLTNAPIYSGALAQRFDRLTDWRMAALMAFVTRSAPAGRVPRNCHGWHSSGWFSSASLRACAAAS